LSKKLRVLSIIAASTLVAGVAVAPAAQAAGTKQKVCVALDTGGINDKSFNQTSYAGALAAKAKGYASTVEYAPAKSNADYAPNLKKFVDKKCTLIIGVGFLVADAIIASAAANPGVKYAIVDYGSGAANVKGITFKTNENSFLMGYLAAGMSKTGKVATYGGIAIPTVTIFMDGYARGVEYYNDVKSKSVQVLGWNPATKTGTFLGSFDDTTKALATSLAFEQQGADVIFPVAGGLQVTTAANSLKSKKSNVIWVDSAVMGTGAKYASVTPVSALKGLNEGVLATVKEAFDGKFTNRQYVGTLKNKGVGYVITPAWSKKIPASLLKEVRDLGTDIAGGWVPAN
jgi:basic membrane protein A and related proteins